MTPRWARMMGSLQTRFLLTVLVPVVTLMAIVIVAVNVDLESLVLDQAREHGIAVAGSIRALSAQAIRDGEEDGLRRFAEEATREGGVAWVVILNERGAVAGCAPGPGVQLADVPTIAPPDLGPASEWVAEFRTAGTGSDRMRVLDVSHGIFLPGSEGRRGTVRVGIDTEPVHRALERIRLVLVLVGTVSVLLAVLGTRIVSRRLGASIEGLVRGTIAVSRGDLAHRIDAKTGDEIAAVATHFNHMTEQVQRQQQEIAIAKRELEILNGTLEEKVARRTRELLVSEQKYRTLVDSSPDPILIVQEGRIRFVNPAFERLFDRREGTDPGSCMEELFHEEDRPRLRELIRAVLAGEATDGGEIRGLTEGGQVRVFDVRGLAINYLGDPAVEVLLHDTTERKELQDHLLQHEKLRALGELASGVAHDFNNILGIILGRAQLLQYRAQDEEVRLGLRTIERAAYDGGETVRRIQDFARSRTERDFQILKVNELLEEVVEITRTRWKDQAELRGVKIDVKLNLGSAPPIRGNASEFREVCTNLIFNAVDAMPKGGRIEISSRAEAGHAVIAMRDTGVGMTEDVRARIFDPFFTTKGTNGMGLGMSVVFGIISRHKGSVTVDSEPGKGTCFTIRIPSVSEESAVRSLEPQPAPRKPGRVLVIDDEAEIAELVTDILESDGHDVKSAASGPEGLRLLASGSFDLLLCDLGMRDMTGWEVVDAVRRDDPAIGIALLTGWGATLAEEDVDAHGVDAVVNKPFEMKKLQETVAALLEATEERRRATSA